MPTLLDPAKTVTPHGYPIIHSRPASQGLGEVPGRIIIAQIPGRPEHRAYVTWWQRNEDGSCHHGHYDMDYGEALNDLRDRR